MFLHSVRSPSSPQAFDLKTNNTTLECGRTYKKKDVRSTQELIDIIKNARENGEIVRARGSEHSPLDHIIDEEEEGILLSLKGELKKVTIHHDESTDEMLYVTAGGGCVLGYNPNKKWKWKKSLCYQVNEEGFALPALGGITHQTIAGFLSTGSAGGSLKYSFTDTIEEITFVNGLGEEQSCSRNNNADLFYAVGVSMGLFGIITQVKFCLKDKRYYVKGNEENKHFNESCLAKPNVKDFFYDNEYGRLNWFPQKHAKIVTEWTGNRSAFNPDDKDPYKNIINCGLVAVGAAFVMSTCNTLLYNSPCEFSYVVIGKSLTSFVCPESEPEVFNDVWYHALPMDNEAHVDRIIAVDFTEVWIPIEKSKDVIDRLNRLYDDSDEGQKAAGNFAVEVYPAKRSEFWLSMSYRTDMIRVDPYWLRHNPCGNAQDYFTYVWNQLLPMKEDGLPVRLHWGKYLPEPGKVLIDKDGDSVTFDLNYLKSVYPKMENWLHLRNENDPSQIFVTKYWRKIFNIQ